MDGRVLSRIPVQTQGPVPCDEDALGGFDAPAASTIADKTANVADRPIGASLDDGVGPALQPPTPPAGGPVPDSSSAGVQVPSSPSISISPSTSTTFSPQSPANRAPYQPQPLTPSASLSRSPPTIAPHTPAQRPGSRTGNFVSQPQPLAITNAWTARSGALQPLRLQTDLQDTAGSLLSPTFRQEPDSILLGTSPLSGIFATSTSPYIRSSSLALQHKTSSSSLRPGSRPPSLKTTGFHGFGSASAASSTVASPIISAMGDVTPLPSPLLSGDSPGPWKRLGRSPPNEAPFTLAIGTPETALYSSNGESFASALAHHAKRRTYTELLASSPGRHLEYGNGRSEPQPVHTRDRSLSEYTPDSLQVPKRMNTVSATHPRQPDDYDQAESSYHAHIRREPHLSEARGLTPVEKPPTPPPSEASIPSSDGTASSERRPSSGQDRHEYFEARGRFDQKRRRWRSLKLLGQGTFSRVMLATNQISSPSGEPALNGQSLKMRHSTSQPGYDRSTLVAVKVCEHGPKGGASEDRIEMSLKRELEIMQSIHHPSLVRLIAWNIEPTRAILVLSYCPGGDLFDVASAHRNILSPRLLARMFSELVGAVRYLHSKHIVHRDVKLENVLVNLTPEELADETIDWAAYPYSVTTLTDLGLSRRVADDEKLETRCGSDDYAAPEVIMGQPYDGRATDAWSLGVLLYALLEGRLPFDPNPGMSDTHRMRSRTSHRIARVEWRWIRYAGEDGDHEGNVSKFESEGLLGAMQITEGLLKRARSRWTLEEVAETPWIHSALSVEGGLQFRKEAEGEEV
ncbi:hypothetical protein SEPCBS119000_002679 [Sporothrix epigloea]|uniref:Protein kinase domain-containing protein n=1 Tax=Sporothrix epigloea TaxID=1892477 RepID=A0ABP0DHG2_9PEZI